MLPILSLLSRLIALKLHAIHSILGEKLIQNLKKKTYAELCLNKYWTILNSDDLKHVVEDSRLVAYLYNHDNDLKTKVHGKNVFSFNNNVVGLKTILEILVLYYI